MKGFRCAAGEPAAHRFDPILFRDAASHEDDDDDRAFSERGTQQSLNENLTRSTGVATHGFGSFHTDQTQRETAAQRCSSYCNATCDCTHSIILFVCFLDDPRSLATVRPSKLLMSRFVRFAFFSMMLVTVLAHQRGEHGCQQREHECLNQTNHQFETKKRECSEPAKDRTAHV